MRYKPTPDRRGLLGKAILHYYDNTTRQIDDVLEVKVETTDAGVDLIKILIGHSTSSTYGCITIRLENILAYEFLSQNCEPKFKESMK